MVNMDFAFTWVKPVIRREKSMVSTPGYQSKMLRLKYIPKALRKVISGTEAWYPFPPEIL
jgi:hypothetical protein